MTRAKVCGITNGVDRDVAVAAGVDALGFTVDVPVETPREIPAGRAAELIAGVPPFVTTVLVTMPAGPAGAADLLDRTGADAIQVHGLDPGEVGEIDARTIAAVDAENPDAKRYERAAGALLVDSTREGGAGGTGRTHDWERTRDLREAVDVPVILAGGLTPENVAQAVQTVEPFGVDVASGVERAGGEKDHEAVRAFVENATRPMGATPR